MNDIEKKEIVSLIQLAVGDLEEFYSKIKKSEKILKYKNDGELMTDIFINILVHFSLAQILELSTKNKIVVNANNYVLPREARFHLCVLNFKDKFEYIYNQHLEIINER